MQMQMTKDRESEKLTAEVKRSGGGSSKRAYNSLVQRWQICTEISSTEVEELDVFAAIASFVSGYSYHKQLVQKAGGASPPAYGVSTIGPTPHGTPVRRQLSSGVNGSVLKQETSSINIAGEENDDA
jgi:hypothetical protein